MSGNNLTPRIKLRAPGVWGIWGEGIFIFREPGSTGYYFQGFEEQAHSFGDLGRPAKNLKNKFKNLTLKKHTFISFDLLKSIFGFGAGGGGGGGGAPKTPPPP